MPVVSACIVRRYLASIHRVTMEFNSPEAMREYLKEHPNADRALHKVKEHPDRGRFEEAEEAIEGMLASRWKLFKSLGNGVVNFIRSAPKAVHTFIVDEKSRKETCVKAAETLAGAPEKVVKLAIDKATREYEEYENAVGAVGKILKREKPSAREAKALKEVATGLAFTVAGVAFTGGMASGVGVLAKSVGKSFVEAIAKKLALVVVHDVLGDYPMFVDMHNTMTGVGLGSAFDKLLKLAKERKPLSDETFLATVITAKVVGRLKDGLDDDFVAQAIKSVSNPLK